MKRLVVFVAVALLAGSCKKDDNNGGTTPAPYDVVYVESNNYMDNQNAILAYKHKDDGTLEQLDGSPYLTGGSGVGDPPQALGPLDSDTEIRITSDGKFLLAVNSGSNTIAVFRIASDGKLTAVSGSPFPSGGQTPVSISIHGQYVYVVNKSHDLAPGHTITEAPNYNVLMMDANGALSSAGSTVMTTPGSSPSQVLVSSDGKFAFGDDFLGFMLMPPKGTLRSFIVNGNGSLAPVDTPQAIPDMGGALGLWQHPSQNVLYVGFPLAGKVGVYSFHSTTGQLTFQTSVGAGLAACWLRTAQNGNRLYCLNSGESTVSMYNTSNASMPVSLGAGKLMLKQPGPNYTVNIMGMPVTLTTSEPFAFEFSADEKFLYVLNQHTNPDFSVGNYNYFHVLSVAADGSLSEPTEPLQLPVPNIYRPQGMAVYRAM